MRAITLRHETREDRAFLRRLYGSTRSEEMASVPWTEALKTAFLDQQFDLQHRHYRTHFPLGEFLIVSLGGQSVGRFYLDRSGEAFLLIDIALLPEHRGLGIGSGLLKSLLTEAETAAKPVRLHAETSSRAFGLYRRLGFAPLETHGIRRLMEWRPA